MIGRWLLVALPLVVACTVDDPGPVALPDRDVDRFAAEVQPVLGATCGSLDCHGASGRPMRLFAVHGRRASGDLRGEDITPTEVAENVAALAALPVDRILGKPLALDAGGLDHVGGELWIDADEPAFVCLAAWLDGEPTPDACDAIELPK